MSTKLALMAADFRTSLSTEIAVGGTTGTLQSATDDDGVVLPTGAYFFTLDGENSSKEHIVCVCTAGALTAIYSVSRQGVQTSGVARKHRIGASVVMTDFAHLMYINNLLKGTTDLNSATPLKYDGVAIISDNAHLATKLYVDNTALAGAPDASTVTKGVVEIATGAELAAGTGTGGTGAVIVPAGSSFKNTSAGAGDANKVPVLNASGVLDQTFLDAVRTWATVQSFTADTAQITTIADSDNDAMSRVAAFRKIFGDASDGAFAQSSGTTTLNTAGKQIWRYSSFALTGTAVLTVGANMQNLPVFIVVDGDLTITSSTNPCVDMRTFGAAGSAGGASGVSGTAGVDASTPTVSNGGGAGGYVSNTGGGGGGGGGFGNPGVAGTAVLSGNGTAGAAGTSERYNAGFTIRRFLDMPFLGGGGGGGAGSTTNVGAGGAGGNGGGCIIFIVRGAINITGVLNAAGSVGTAGSAGDAGGGGGGGGGFIGVFYLGALTANSGTFTVTGGAGGAKAGNGGVGGVGGAGQSIVKQIKIDGLML